MLKLGHIVFRVDSSSEMGIGHLSRCLALACAFREFEFSPIFFSRDLDGARFDLIQKNGFTLFSFQAQTILDDINFTIKKISEVGAIQLMIVDSYQLDLVWERAIHPYVKKIAVIDDLANRAHHCDYLLNHNPGINQQDYVNLIPSDAKILIGTKFALLAKEYYLKHRVIEEVRSHQENLNSVLICCGGSDPLNITDKILNVIMQNSLNLTYHVVIGKSYVHRDAMLSRSFPDYILCYDDVDGLAEMMSACQLAIGSGGITALERCSLGVPSIVMIAADNQVSQVNALADQSIISFLDINSENFHNELIELLLVYQHDPFYLKKQQQQGLKLCDGAGVYRVITTLYSADQQIDEDFYLRLADMDDAEIILSWQQYPNARQYSRNSLPPTRDEHFSWCEQYFKNENRMMMIFYQEKPVGFIRLDYSDYMDCDYEISILISNDYQGKGLAKRSIFIVCQLYSNCKFYANVKSENKASIALFKKSGFIEYEKENYIYGN